jgi:hypothetical protein
MTRTLLAEFERPDALARAIGELRRRGYKNIDAFTPYPVQEIEDALGEKRSPINWMVLPFWVAAAGAAYLVQWYCDAYDYPIDVGGRPPHSVPTFVPITFEMGVLGAALAALLLFFLLSGLPQLFHPVFDAEGFDRATDDRFFLGVDDAVFDDRRTERELLALGAARVTVTGETS